MTGVLADKVVFDDGELLIGGFTAHNKADLIDVLDVLQKVDNSAVIAVERDVDEDNVDVRPCLIQLTINDEDVIGVESGVHFQVRMEEGITISNDERKHLAGQLRVYLGAREPVAVSEPTLEQEAGTPTGLKVTTR